jgi:VanZ family protein
MKHIKINLMVILFLLYMTALGLLCFLHGDSLPNITGTWFGFRADNVAHAAMFLPFIPLAFLSISIRKTNILKDMLLLIFVTVAGACTAYATELIQGQLKYRSYELKDFMADCVGLAGGFIFITVCLIIWHSIKKR